MDVATIRARGAGRKVLSNEKGIALAFVAIFLAAMVAMAGLMLDTSRIALTATEVQTAADLSALAGAMARFGTKRSDPNAAAIAALQSNQAGGESLNGSNLSSLLVGNWTESRGFVANLPPLNAVKTVTRTNVGNMLMGAFSEDGKTTEVTKEAIAAMGTLGSGIATLPIVLGDCHFSGGSCYSDSCMPTLTQVPNTTNQSAWTAFFDNASNTNIQKYLDPGCNGASDGDAKTASIRVGDMINLSNGQVNNVLFDPISKMVNNCNRREFLIPIVSCAGNYNQAKAVLGFATILVDQVKSQGTPKGIWLHGIYKNTPGTFTTGTSYGTVTIKLVG